MEGYTGTKIGVIGSLAAVGLRKGGNDGRNIWLKGTELRDLSGVYTASKLKELINIQVIKSVDEKLIEDHERVEVGNWLRPVIQDNRITVIVEKNLTNENYDWKLISKDYIKSISD